MTDAIVAVPDEAPSKAASHVLILCAFLVAAARFVPVPFLDDIVRTRLLQVMVSRTLKANGRVYSSSLVAPLWQDGGACGTGCLSFFWRVPLKLLLYPIRKLVTLFKAITGFAKEVTRTLLLGHTLGRVLLQGALASPEDPLALRRDAQHVRAAFESAYAGSDTSIIVAALYDSLRHVEGLPRAAFRSARALWRSRGVSPETASSDTDQDVMERGAAEVEHTLERKDVQAALKAFDARFDAAWQAATATAPP